MLHGNDYGLLQPMDFCPWCGTKLPKDLGIEWTEMVEKELGIEDVWDIEWDEIPEKYKTDEWWKKRGITRFKVVFKSKFLPEGIHTWRQNNYP